MNEKEQTDSEAKTPDMPLGLLPQPPTKGARVNVSFESLPKYGNPVLPVLWFDIATISARSGPDEPELATLRFYVLLPEAAIEIVRMQTTIKQIKSIMNVLAKNLNYYPEKPPTEEAAPP